MKKSTFIWPVTKISAIFQALWSRLTPQSISAKLNLMILVAVIGMIVLGSLSIFMLIRSETSFQEMGLLNAQAEQVNHLFKLILQSSDGLNEIINEGKGSLAAKVLAQQEEMLTAFSAYKTTAQEFGLSDDYILAIENEPIFLEIRDVSIEAISLFREGQLDQARSLKERVDRDIQHVLVWVEDSAFTRQTAIEDKFAEIATLRRNLLYLQIGVFAAGSLLVFGIGYRIARGISSNLTELTDVALQITAGDLNPRAPIRSNDELGTLATTFNQMTDNLRQMVEAEQIAGQKAVQLAENLSKTNTQLKTVTALNERLTSILDVDQLLEQLVEQVKESFGYYHAHIYILTEDSFDTGRKLLVVRAGTGEAGEEMKGKGHSIPISAPTSLVARVARSGEVVRVDNVREAQDWLPNPLLPDTYCEMAVPIVSKGEVLGVLDVQENKIGGLDDSDADLLHTLADQVAVALTNARLFEQAFQAKAEAEQAKAEAEQAKEQAERAKEQAQAANKILEQQIWQTAGLAQLSETMRGEQDIPTLANNIIQHLCRYLQVQIGALYVVKDQYLKRQGRFAHNGKNQPQQFKIGEGLVGQTALEKRPVLVREVPDDYITMRSGLGEQAPTTIMLFPFIYNDQVVGVIELGTMGEFSQAQMEFIETALASIAIAFNTALARTRINELLAQTLPQAEELQVSES